MNKKIPRLIGSRHKPESEIERLFQLAIRNTNWEEYQRRVDAGVAREVDAYAESRFKSIGLFQRLVLN
jgi:hypothetical protein